MAVVYKGDGRGVVYFKQDFIKMIDSFSKKRSIEKRTIERNGKKYEFEFNVYNSQRCEEV